MLNFLPGDALYVVKTNDTYASIVKVYGNFTLTQFYTWNPAVGTSCKYLDIGKLKFFDVIFLERTPHLHSHRGCRLCRSSKYKCYANIKRRDQHRNQHQTLTCYA
jgi:hypothetical protein